MTQEDVVDLIQRDHREFEQILADMKTDATHRPQRMSQLTMLLTAHERAEEAEVYPVAAKSGEADDVAHRVDEHLEVDRLLTQLGQLEPVSPEFEELLETFADAVQNHIDGEEATLLAHVREKLADDRRQQVGAAFMAARNRYIDQQPEDAAPLGDTWVP